MARLTVDMLAVRKPSSVRAVGVNRAAEEYLQHVRVDLAYAELALILAMKLRAGIIGGCLSFLDKLPVVGTELIAVAAAVAK